MKALQERLPHHDAGRFLAFFPIFLHHLVNQFDWPNQIKQHLSVGIIGLDYFFVLSGFIVSYRYLKDPDVSDRFTDIRRYFVRRIGRTWPMYFLWFFLALVSGWFKWTDAETGSLLHWLTFSLNFQMMKEAESLWFPAAVLWSICIEEQLYLGLGLMLLFKRWIPFFVFLLIVASIVFRSMASESELYFHTFSYLGNFGLGIIIPFLGASTLKAISGNLLCFWAFILLLFGALCYPVWFHDGFMLIMERLYFSSIFMIIIINWTYQEKPLFNLRQWNWLSRVGNWSLGLYLYHTVAIVITFKLIKPDHFGNILFGSILAIALTLFASFLSSKYFEIPINKFIRNFEK